MHKNFLYTFIMNTLTHITRFLAICPCLDLAHTFPLSCSMHLSSSLCCVWFVRADDESVYEWRELISPEWSLSLSLTLCLSPLLSLQYLSIQSKRISLCPRYPRQCCSFLQGAPAAWCHSLISVVSWRGHWPLVYLNTQQMRFNNIPGNTLHNPAAWKCLIVLRGCFNVAFPHLPRGCRLHANTNNKRQPQSKRHKFNNKKKIKKCLKALMHE